MNEVHKKSACMLLDVVNSAILMLYAFIVIMLLLLGVLKDRYAMGVFAEAKAGCDHCTARKGLQEQQVPYLLWL